eukprot:323094-Pyramimonas_sp.AAC.1
MICCAVLCCAVLRCAVLCYAMICCAMLCCAGLCYATLCYAMLCSAMIELGEAKMKISNAKLRGRSWGNRGADARGTAQGVSHCPAPLS